jgi:hypothetical protein
MVVLNAGLVHGLEAQFWHPLGLSNRCGSQARNMKRAARDRWRGSVHEVLCILNTYWFNSERNKANANLPSGEHSYWIKYIL